MYKKIKKIFKKININLRNLDKNIKYVVKKSNELYITILFDILLCKILYNISSYEYRIYEFYNISHYKRKTFLSKKRYELYKKLYINKNILNIINNKIKIYLRFKNYLNREVKNINDISYKEFENIILENKKILCRSVSSNFVSNHKIFNLNDYRGPGFILEKMKENNLLLVEKFFEQNEILNKISSSLVVINIGTLCYNKSIDVLSTTISFNENDKIIKGFIDCKTMKLKGHLRCNNEIYKEEEYNYKIPCLKEIISISKKMALELSEIKLVEWSFTINRDNEIYFVDANIWDDYEFVQLREYLNNKNGILPKLFKKNR